ncbi:unnamed protein product [Phyllotreta striolata]|uniref:F-box domain-containing protein n=1 Tax=Phyllotreta striolata TaxID=444603 RepID=A0A9N9U1N4_PHYSR|nr:unnamed protein product [Phyllotreta striolata]
MFLKSSNEGASVRKPGYSSTNFLCRGYDSLPQSVLLNVFKYLHEDELRRHVIFVCKKWRACAEHKSLWKTLEFAGSKAKNALIISRIMKYDSAETIILRRIKEPAPVVQQICRFNRNISHLTLRHCQEIDEDCLRQLLETCKNLKSLDLKGTGVKLSIVCEELACAESLSSLNIGDNKHLTVPLVASIIVNCHHLVGFHLCKFQPANKVFLTDVDIGLLFANTNYRLEALTLDCSSFGRPTFSAIMKCRKLEYLCLNCAHNLEGGVFETMAETLTRLRALKVRFGYQIADDNFKKYFGCRENFDLEEVDFTGCAKIGSGGLKSLADSCPKVKSLVLRNCPNVVTLDEVFCKCPGIETLNVAFCGKFNFSDNCVPANLKQLFISDYTRFERFVKNSRNDKVAVRICQSEYNKTYKTLYVNAFVSFVAKSLGLYRMSH